MTKSIGCLLVLLLSVTLAHADNVPTAQFSTISGTGYLVDAISAGFFISSSQFSAGSGTPDWNFECLLTPALIPTLPFQQNTSGMRLCGGLSSYSYSETPKGLMLSVTGFIPSALSAGFNHGCDGFYTDASYRGLHAPCIGGGISFTGESLVSSTAFPGGAAYLALGTFTATGEVIGYGPENCAGINLSSCNELFDVTFSGRGTMTLTSGFNYFNSVRLHFVPTPEPATAPMFLCGTLLLTALAVWKRLRASA
ncbi:MAG: hypothetical protein ACRD2B_08870 [Terriglobia bacterium]